MENVDLVIVTYNRLEKLKYTLACYDNQTADFRNLIVVDNHSTDGTHEYLQDWLQVPSSYTKYVRTLDSNRGGSGGFYEGQCFAMTMNPDWIYLADDDAYAAPDMIERFYAFHATHQGERIAALCGAVQCMDNQINYNHRGRYVINKNGKYIRTSVPKEEYDKDYFDIDLLSYVCSFINAEAIKAVGMVNPDYFIYFDDTEHSIRLKKWGQILCVPSIQIKHDEILRNQQINADLTWRDYYSDRNELRMLKAHHPEAYYKEAEYILRVSYRHYQSNGLSAKDKVCLEALKDAILNRGGVHTLYHPGWKYEEGALLTYPKYWILAYFYVRIRKVLKNHISNK